MDKNTSFAEANARRIRIIKANGNSGCKSTAFVSFPIKSSNGARRDRYIVIAAKTLSRKKSPCLAARSLREMEKKFLVRRGSSLLLVWTGSFPRTLSERIFFASAQVSLRDAASNFDRRDDDVSRKFHRIIRRDSGSSGNNPQSVLVE